MTEFVRRATLIFPVNWLVFATYAFFVSKLLYVRAETKLVVVRVLYLLGVFQCNHDPDCTVSKDKNHH